MRTRTHTNKRTHTHAHPICSIKECTVESGEQIFSRKPSLGGAILCMLLAVQQSYIITYLQLSYTSKKLVDGEMSFTNQPPKTPNTQTTRQTNTNTPNKHKHTKQKQN